MEAQFIAQTWSYPAARINQVETGYGAAFERRSKRLPGSLLDVEEAVSFYDGMSIGEVAWGDHKAVIQTAFDPPEFEWEDSFPLETGYFFENNQPGFFYGKAQAQARWTIGLPFAWRDIDGPGIIVTVGRLSRSYDWDDEEGEYILSSEENFTDIYNIAVAVGELFVTTPTMTLSIVGGEGSEIMVWPAAIKDNVTIGFSSDGGSSGGFIIPPYETMVSPGIPAQGSECYSENRGGVLSDLTLRFSYPASSPEFPTVVTFVKTTRDLAGAIIGEAADSASITGEDVEKLIPAPGTEGRVYCHSFDTASQRFAGLPFVLAEQVCPEFPS